MLKTENFTLDHIRTLKANSDSDSAILERTVYAFGLLESLVRVHMPFTFKEELVCCCCWRNLEDCPRILILL